MLRAKPFLSLADIDHRLIIFLSFFFFPLSLFPIDFPSPPFHLYIFHGRKRARVGNDCRDIIESSGNRIFVLFFFFFFPSTIYRMTVQRRLLQLGLIKIDALEGGRKRGWVTVDPTPPDRVHSRFISVNGFNANFIRVTGVVSICNSNRPPILRPSLRRQYAHNLFYIA